MSTDVYSAPESELIEQKEDIESASRWFRLWASIADTIIMLLFLLPLMYFTGMFDSLSNPDAPEPSALVQGGVALAGFAFFALLNFYFLYRDGQTLGKKLANIKIVTLNDEPIKVSHILKRYGFYWGIGYIPGVGDLLGIINVLLIFGKQKRCGHDLVAGTRVIDC